MNQSIPTVASGAGQCVRLLARLSALGMTLALSFTLLLAAPEAAAQLTTSDIVGTITDATGAVVPNASIILVNLDTRETRTASASGSGDYQFTLLPVGRYSLTVKSPGFKTNTTPSLPSRLATAPATTFT